MGTTVNEIYDVAMSQITDYRLDALFQTSEPDFEAYMEFFLDFAIFDFDICDQSLVYSSGSSKEFPEVLTTRNKHILATLMMKHWMQKNANDITQMNLHVGDKDFKVPSEAPNLREKTNSLNVIKEQCAQMLVDYAYKNVDWTEWYNQSFSGI